ncbi:T9SS type A sorting domain-containing protein [Aquimarina sp. RZ0]|uniref:T9SS type A sorting domain-containing protein n=1 Tax=Aquimarina sp. RZ0 TaxID=2607730 RepID=UPI0011F33F0E|nr:T9SS type A sorting domain-containing protein [Aquimarina sp. RZ0]KAA1248120.1 T9SS type A sorting domain-containing protein [Aquimarina sp. RZ0]
MNSLKTFLSIFFIAFSIIISNAQVKIGQGVTSPEDWINYNTTGIYVDVDTKSCGFTTTPHYLITLESVTNKGSHWYISGVPSLYNVTPTGFRVYIRWTDAPSDLPTVGPYPNPLRASTAKDRDWVIRWTGIEMRDCNPSRETLRTVNQIFSGPNGPEGDITSKDIESETSTVNNLKIYPNPSQDRLIIQYSGAVEKSEIYDLNSRLLNVSKTNSIDIKKLPKGNYLVKIYDIDGTIITKQFMK